MNIEQQLLPPPHDSSLGLFWLEVTILAIVIVLRLWKGSVLAFIHAFFLLWYPLSLRSVTDATKRVRMKPIFRAQSMTMNRPFPPCTSSYSLLRSLFQCHRYSFTILNNVTTDFRRSIGALETIWQNSSLSWNVVKRYNHRGNLTLLPTCYFRPSPLMGVT